MPERTSTDHLMMAGWLVQPRPYTVPPSVRRLPRSLCQWMLIWLRGISAVPKAAFWRMLSLRKVNTPPG